MRGIALLTLAILVAISSLRAFGNQAGPTNDYQIVPGQRIGPWVPGKPLETYGLNQPRFRWEGERIAGIPYYDGYAFLVGSDGPQLDFRACKIGGLVFAITLIRLTHLPAQAQPEALKYRTAQGIGIGSSEAEVLQSLGRPERVGEWATRHGTQDVKVIDYNYPGIILMINRADKRVFGITVESQSARAECARSTAAMTMPAPFRKVFGDLRLVPRDRMGGIVLGSLTLQEVEARFGPSTNMGGRPWRFWSIWQPSGRFDFWLNLGFAAGFCAPNNKLFAVWAFAVPDDVDNASRVNLYVNTVTTPEGLSLNSTGRRLAQFVEAYGQPVRVIRTPGLGYYFFDNNLIILNNEETRYLWGIGIFNQNICTTN